MTITLDSRFTIEVDAIGNHTLVEHVRKGGKTTTRTHGHFRDIPSAVRKYLAITTIEDVERTSLEGYVVRYENAVRRLLEGVRL